MIDHCQRVGGCKTANSPSAVNSSRDRTVRRDQKSSRMKMSLLLVKECASALGKIAGGKTIRDGKSQLVAFYGFLRVV